MKVTWRQNGKNRLILNIEEPKRSKEFQIDDSVVNFLAETKHVHLHIVTGGFAEESVLVNFSGIRAIAAGGGRGGPLKNLQTAPSSVSGDRMAVARGETFQSKWLTPKGWDQEKHYFALHPYIDEPDMIHCPACQKAINASSVFCGYCGFRLADQNHDKKCINTSCGKSIRGMARFCPYCGTKQGA